jgi:hemerythrin
MEIQMGLFKWYKKYSVNNNELDEHHKTLFDIFNRLYDNCLLHDKAHCIDPIIEELKSYSNYHFTAEEHHMGNIGYKEIDNHIAEHGDFTQRTLQLQQVADKDEPEATKELVAFLGNWLLHHVIEEDKKYAV